MKKVILYTDGACSGNQNDTNLGGWGTVLTYGQHQKELFGGEANTTNNRMEMMAVIKGLESLNSKDLQVDVYSDSAYVIDCFTKKWYKNWQKNGWKTASKKPVENKELWEQLIDLSESFTQINFYRVKGHLSKDKTAEINKWFKKFLDWNGQDYTLEDFLYIVDMNNLADALANKGIDTLR